MTHRPFVNLGLSKGAHSSTRERPRLTRTMSATMASAISEGGFTAEVESDGHVDPLNVFL